MCMNVLVTGISVCLLYGGQKRRLVPLELEIEMIVSCHVDTGNLTWVSRRVATVLKS